VSTFKFDTILIWKKTMMKSLYIFLLSITTVSSLYSQTQQQGYAASLIPDELLENADAVVREHDVKFLANNLNKAKIKFHSATTVLNSKANFNKLSVHYSSFSRVNKVSATLYNKYGKEVKKFKKRDFKDLSTVGYGTLADDGRMKYIKVTHNDYPYTIVFDYELDYFCVPFYPDWRVLSRTRTSVQNTTHEISVGKGMGVRYKAYNIDAEPSIGKDSKGITYKWRTQNVVAFDASGFLPKYDAIFPKVQIEPTAFSMGKEEGDLSSWSRMGDFYFELNKNRDELPQNIAEELKILTANAESDQEKISLIYKYLQDNTRYVSIQLGIGGWQTFKADYVAENKYGDCKALTNYMKSMLKSVGVTSYAALVQSGRRIKDIDENFTANVFNHVILNIPQEGEEDIWLECTSQYSPMNYLSSFTENRYALLITPEGGKLVKTPHKKHQFHQKINKATVKIEANGNAIATVAARTFDDEHDEWRYAFNELSKKEQKEALRESIELPSFNVDEMQIDLSDKLPQAALNYELSITKLAKKTARRIFLVPNLLSRRSYIPSSEERAFPIEVIKGYTHIDTIVYTIPSGYVSESIPHDNFEINTEFGKYSMEVTLVENKLTYIRQFELFAFSKPKEEYEALRDFYTKVVKADNMKIVLVKK
jgi:transglutaminase-like putative cysteine protease